MTLGGVRIGFASLHDPADPRRFSGAPAGLLEALRDLGADVVPLAATPEGPIAAAALRINVAARLRPRDVRDLRGGLDRVWPQADAGRVMAKIRALHLRRRVARLERPLDGVIQYGTEYLVPLDVPLVTYEDTTVRQALASWPWKHLAGARPGDVDLYERRSRTAYDRATACCAMSHWAADSMRHDYGVPQERVHVVGLGATAPFGPPADRDWSVPRYLFVGFDWKRKNGDRVVAAFSRVRRSHPEATLDIVGRHPDRVDVPGVRLHGVLPLSEPESARRLGDLYARATCFVMPSLLEPGGLVYAIAARAGLPSVGTARGGAATTIGDGGRLVEPEDDDAIAAAMLDLADPFTAERLGALAHERSRLFTWSAVAQRLVRALELPGVDAGRLATFL